MSCVDFYSFCDVVSLLIIERPILWELKSKVKTINIMMWFDLIPAMIFISEKFQLLIYNKT